MNYKARELTTFTSLLRLYQFLRITFGLKNVPDKFQRGMIIVLETVRLKLAPVYLDDFIILYKTAVDHLRHVEAVLQLLQSAEVSLQLEM